MGEPRKEKIERLLVNVDVISVLEYLKEKALLIGKQEVADLIHIVLEDDEDIHGNAERFARRREQCLGAALSEISLTASQQRLALDAADIARRVELNAARYWPEEGVPPLNTQGLTRLISAHWNKI